VAEYNAHVSTCWSAATQSFGDAYLSIGG
jgi:hypothetical protein